jgi:hypothetical protein
MMMNVMKCIMLQLRLMGGHSDSLFAGYTIFMALLINPFLMSTLQYIKNMHGCCSKSKQIIIHSKNNSNEPVHFPQPGQQ